MKRSILGIGLGFAGLAVWFSQAGTPPVLAGEDSRIDKAYTCLQDPSCSYKDALALIEEAIAKDDNDSDCLDLYDGTVVRQDRDKAFKCFERRLSKSECNENTVNLAYMLINGTHLPADPARAKTLTEKCGGIGLPFAIDRAAEILKSEPAEALPLVDACDFAESTVEISSCANRSRFKQEIELSKIEKSIYKKLDPAQRKLLLSAESAWRDFIDVEANLQSGGMGSGTAANIIYPAVKEERMRERAHFLQDFFSFSITTGDALIRDRLEADVNAKIEQEILRIRKEYGDFSGPRDLVKENIDLVNNGQAKWLAFKKAELDLFKSVFGSKGDSAAIELAVSQRLLQDRARFGVGIDEP